MANSTQTRDAVFCATGDDYILLYIDADVGRLVGTIPLLEGMLIGLSNWITMVIIHY